MPFTKLHVPESYSSELCEALSQLIHDSLVETCDVDPDDFFCLVARYPQGDMFISPTFMGNRSSKSTVVVEILLLIGRSHDQKENLYKEIRRRIAKTDARPEDAIIYLIENREIDWSFSSAGSVRSVIANQIASGNL